MAARIAPVLAGLLAAGAAALQIWMGETEVLPALRTGGLAGGPLMMLEGAWRMLSILMAASALVFFMRPVGARGLGLLWVLFGAMLLWMAWRAGAGSAGWWFSPPWWILFVVTGLLGMVGAPRVDD